MTDDVMDDELLAPPAAEGATMSVPEAGTWRFEHGIADSRNVLRLWVDPESRQLQRVKLSAQWRERLAGRSLADAFMEAFFFANMRVEQSPDLHYPEIEVPEVDDSSTHEQLMERFEVLLERMEELEARAPENVRWADFAGERVRISGRGGVVTVRLSLAGLTEKIEFDKDWLATASSSEICEQVLTVHDKAYRRYVPPVFVPGEREVLAAEFAQVLAAIQSQLSEGIA